MQLLNSISKWWSFIFENIRSISSQKQSRDIIPRTNNWLLFLMLPFDVTLSFKVLLISSILNISKDFAKDTAYKVSYLPALFCQGHFDVTVRWFAFLHVIRATLFFPCFQKLMPLTKFVSNIFRNQSSDLIEVRFTIWFLVFCHYVLLDDFKTQIFQRRRRHLFCVYQFSNDDVCRSPLFRRAWGPVSAFFVVHFFPRCFLPESR